MENSISPTDVSRETLAKLGLYAALLEKWNPKINLVSRSTIPDLWQRHIWDSAQIYPMAPAGDLWLDIGSGAGFPGLVAAVLAVQFNPLQKFRLVESDQRKAAFLRTVIRELGLNATVDAKRVEELPAANADILSARALADLSILLTFADRHLSPTGTAIFLKGETWENEVEAARTLWHFECEKRTSQTDPNAAILLIKGIHRA